jgi:hypothetical protein
VKFAATANITGQDRTPPGRRAAPFIGGPQTGWVSTAYLENLVHEPIRRDLGVTTARAISGAAFAAAMGSQTRFFEVFLALTNVRLGAWLPNPWFVALKRQHLDDWTIPGLPSRRRLILLAREIFGIHPSWARMLLCTDGGHYDNLGLIELLRLRCKSLRLLLARLSSVVSWAAVLVVVCRGQRRAVDPGCQVGGRALGDAGGVSPKFLVAEDLTPLSG